MVGTGTRAAVYTVDAGNCRTLNGSIPGSGDARCPGQADGPPDAGNDDEEVVWVGAGSSYQRSTTMTSSAASGRVAVQRPRSATVDRRRQGTMMAGSVGWQRVDESGCTGGAAAAAEWRSTVDGGECLRRAERSAPAEVLFYVY